MKKYMLLLCSALALCACIDTEYVPTATLRVLRNITCPISSEGKGTLCTGTDNNSEINNVVRLIKSIEVSDAVLAQLTPDEKIFWKEKTPVVEVLKNSLIIHITCPTPNAELSAKLANLYAAKTLEISQQENAKEFLMMIKNLQEKVIAQDLKVKALEAKLVEFRTATTQDGISLDQRSELCKNELLQLNAEMLKKKQNSEDSAAIQKTIDEKKTELVNLSQKIIDYKVIEREKKAADSLLSELATQVNKRTSEINLIPPSVRIVDYASAQAPMLTPQN